MLINKKKILIFGSNGFLGHYTYNFLKKKKLQVIKIPKKLSTLYKLNKKIDIILHFAGSSKANKDSFYKNIIITLKVLNFIKKKSNKNTILFFFSSTNIYKKKKKYL